MYLTEFVYNNNYHLAIHMAPIEALYSRRFKSPVLWDEASKKQVLGVDILEYDAEHVQQIRKILLIAQSRQKSYADRRRHDLEFNVGDHVFLRVSLMKRVVQFGWKGKLTPHYVGLFQVLEKIGVVVYRLALPPRLSHVSNVFHMTPLT